MWTHLRIWNFEIAEPQFFFCLQKAPCFSYGKSRNHEFGIFAGRNAPICEKVQEVDCEVGQGWAAAYPAVAQRMLDHLNNSEMLKLNTRELEFHVLAPSSRMSASSTQ